MNSRLIQASVRAMDAVQQFSARLGISVPETFVVSGVSKVTYVFSKTELAYVYHFL
jgi:hypothetical protein